MYSLRVIKPISLPDGRLYMEGHNCNSLSAFEVAELVYNYPMHFRPNDDMTAEFMERQVSFIEKVGPRKAEETKESIMAKIKRILL